MMRPSCGPRGIGRQDPGRFTRTSGRRAVCGYARQSASGVFAPWALTPPRSATLPAEPLSGREREVLRLLATDRSVPEIARALFVSSSTVRSHVKHIFGKLDAHSRYEAVVRARALGLLRKPDDDP